MPIPMQVLKVMASSADSTAFLSNTHTERMCGEQQFKSWVIEYTFMFKKFASILF